MEHLKEIKSIFSVDNHKLFFSCFFDTKFIALIREKEEYIYRFTHQQFFIVISCVIMVNIIFNEKYLRSINNYLLIYIGDVKKDIFASFFVITISNIVAFICGQSLLLLLNYIKYNQVIVSLFFVNIIVVSCEIATAVFLVMALRLILKKNILVYGMFSIIVFFSILINNVFVSIPLTIRILGADENGYYLTYGLNLWIGRMILLLLAYLLFGFGQSKFLVNNSVKD